MGEVLVRSEAMSIEAFAFRTVETMASCAEVCVWGYTRCTLTHPLGMILFKTKFKSNILLILAIP